MCSCLARPALVASYSIALAITHDGEAAGSLGRVARAAGSGRVVRRLSVSLGGARIGQIGAASARAGRLMAVRRSAQSARGDGNGAEPAAAGAVSTPEGSSGAMATEVRVDAQVREQIGEDPALQLARPGREEEQALILR